MARACRYERGEVLGQVLGRTNTAFDSACTVDTATHVNARTFLFFVSGGALGRAATPTFVVAIVVAVVVVVVFVVVFVVVVVAVVDFQRSG